MWYGVIQCGMPSLCMGVDIVSSQSAELTCIFGGIIRYDTIEEFNVDSKAEYTA